MHLRCGGMFSNYFTARLLLSPTVKEIWIYRSTFGEVMGKSWVSCFLLTHGVVSSLFSPWNPQNLPQSFYFKNAERASQLPSLRSDSHIRTPRHAVLPLSPLFRCYTVTTAPQYLERWVNALPCLVLLGSLWYIQSFVVIDSRYGQVVSYRNQIDISICAINYFDPIRLP